MSLAPLDASRTALLILDMHACIAGPDGNAATHAAEQNLVPNIVRLRDAADATGVPVVFVQHRRPHGIRPYGQISSLFREIADDPDLQPGSAGLAMLPELQVEEGDIVIEKQRASAFTGTELDITLRAMGIDTILLTGAWTNLSVESTARYATDIGYAAVVASDGTASESAPWHEIALTGGLSAVASVATVSEIVAALG
ncbi:isochorismatase family cysteine hydrolase [Aeromicrobium sp. 9AM]|uniref:isochorismatase family cysteine hydrolase n=1 Tax=Aeromicrobium sp. 9AM TaxID=2653126 RepID=UPI0012F32156|nr:isochorismatase family cysteine hydrolase [Aeromicrobium sp. 9AM]VXB62824.1 conserved hypothetical protein [Aeromicrobium sp. 9AM]